MDDQTKRALREIRASLKGQYDREAVRGYLREAFRPGIEQRNAERGNKVARAVIDAQCAQGAATVEQVLWEGLDNAVEMGVVALLIVALSAYTPIVGQRIGATEMAKRNHKMSVSALKRRLPEIGEDMKAINQDIEKKRLK